MRKLKMNQMEHLYGGWDWEKCAYGAGGAVHISMMSGAVTAGSAFGGFGGFAVMLSAAAVGCVLSADVTDTDNGRVLETNL